MHNPVINHNTVEIALDRCDGHAFERFGQAYMAGIFGTDFVPLGGVHDGGADAFFEVFQAKDKAGHFVQITRQENYASKIRQTVQRLHESGRQPARLTYFSARVIPDVDQAEENLSTELNVRIYIKDQKYITSHINYNQTTQSAFESHLATFVGQLSLPGQSSLVSSTDGVQLRSVAVFLAQEIENRTGEKVLSHKIVDALIIWSLRETDPDKDIFKTKDEILAEILQNIPNADQLLTGSLEHRLTALTAKDHPDGRQINRHVNKRRRGQPAPVPKYCLPFETRTTIRNENADDEALKSAVLAQMANTASKVCETKSFTNINPIDVAKNVLAVFEKAFEDQGIIIANHFRQETAPENNELLHLLAKHLNDNKSIGEEGPRLLEACADTLYFTFTKSTHEQKTFFNRLSRTYALFFSIQNEPRIAEWMRNTSSNFVLYVGSDIILKSITERFCNDENRQATNALRILKECDSTLIFTDPALDELHTHLIASNEEFKNHYQEHEHYLKDNIVQACNRPLIRAYLDARISPEPGITRPKSWIALLNSILPYELLYEESGKEALKAYLIEHFQMEFETLEDLQKITDAEQVDALTQKMVRTKSRKGEKAAELLAKNDALLACAVYGKRIALGEAHKPSYHGHRTWWLTSESSILTETTDLIRSKGRPFMMRPEFVMQYVALNPATEAISLSYKQVFPSTIGLSLGSYVPENLLHTLLDKLETSEDFDEARLKVEAAKFQNQLMADFTRQYMT